MAFELILPFLRPIAHLIVDDAITEIMVNGDGRIWIERQGMLEHVSDLSLDPRSLRVAVQTIARTLGNDISEDTPLLDARLPDGSRIAAVMPPISLGGITLTIRKHRARFFTPDDLVASGSVPAPVLRDLETMIRHRHNVLITGGTGTGKTTLLNALTEYIPPSDRIVVIEDTAELRIDRTNLVRFEARREQPNQPAVTIRDLLRTTLRHRPDRIILGEVRGGEAFDLLQAWNTGHSGSLTTLHANNATQALTRLASCVLMSGVELPYLAIRASLAETIHAIVHVERRGPDRVVSELVRIDSFRPDTNAFEITRLYGSE